MIKAYSEETGVVKRVIVHSKGACDEYKNFLIHISRKRFFMSISFYPKMGQMLMADFSDLSEPEMTKIRPVVVISPKLPYRSELVAIVPVSLTAPRHTLPFCYQLSRNYHPLEDDNLSCWAKADMVMNIALKRLNGFKTGRRRWIVPEISEADLAGIRNAVLCGLGFKTLAAEI